jgi:CBS domain-containing protein
MIGRTLLVRVRQIMRPREALALVTAETTVRSALKTMTEVRAGAAVVADDEQKLLGFLRMAILRGIFRLTRAWAIGWLLT